MIKVLAAQILEKLAVSPRWGKIMDNSLLKAADFYRRNRMNALEGPDAQLYRDLFGDLVKDLTVKNGPFKGMRYPEAQAAGSALLPKLLGSYERELHPVSGAADG